MTMNEEQHTKQQEAEFLRLQGEIIAVQSEIATTVNELVQTQGQTILLEAGLADDRKKIVQAQVCIIMQKKEAQA